MYSRRTQPARKKALFWTLSSLVGIILILAILELTHFIHIFHHQSIATTGTDSHINYSPPTTAQKQAGEQTKEQNMPGPPTPSTTPSNPSPTTPNVTVTIVRLGQVSAGQNINLRATLSGNAPNGQCVAIFTKSGQSTVTQTTGISSDPTYYSCEPLDVSASQFSANGTWNVTVYVQVDGSIVSNKATGTVTVQL